MEVIKISEKKAKREIYVTCCEETKEKIKKGLGEEAEVYAITELVEKACKK